MRTNAISKLSGSTGDVQWTMSTDNPIHDDSDYPQPVRLFADNSALYATIPVWSNTDTDTIVVASINKASGSVNWGAGLSDMNSANRRYPGTLNTHFSDIYSDMTTNADHVFVTLHRPMDQEGINQDGVNIFGLPKSGVFEANEAGYSILSTLPNWNNVTGDPYFFSMTPEPMPTNVSIDSGDINNLLSPSTMVDHIYSLPPVFTDVKPSLEVTNIAKVGQLVVGDTSPPTSAFGGPGDMAGMIRWDSTGMWVCTADYTGDGSAIWSSAPYSAPGGGRFKPGPVGYSANLGQRVGIPGDTAGDIRLVGDKVYYCTSNYTGTTDIWRPTVPITMGTGINVSTNQNWGSTSDPAYPTGQIITDSSMTISVATGGLPVVDMTGWTWLYSTDGRGAVLKYNPTTPNQLVYMIDYWSGISSGWSTIVSNESYTNPMILNSATYGGATINGMPSYIIGPRQQVQLYLTGNDYRTVGFRRPISVIDYGLSGGTYTLDARYGTNYRMLLNSNSTLANPTNLVNGDEFSFIVVQGSSWTLSYGTMFKWAGGTVPAITAGAGKVDLITARYNASLNILLCTITKDIR